MKRTNVFATKDEIDSLKKPVRYMVFSGVEPESPLEKCHRMALSHGLPEIKGYYGCDLRTGEFVSAEDSEGSK
jgi:hypothetical protein